MSDKEPLTRIPDFASDQEMHDWMNANRERVDAYVAGKLERGETIPRAERQRQKLAAGQYEATEGTTHLNIRLASADVERARRQAERKGMRYQTYIKTLLHEALERAE